MSTTTSISQYDYIACNGTSTVNHSSYDSRWSSHSSSDTWYFNFICANSFSYYINAEYDFWGSDHIRVVFYRAALTQVSANTASLNWTQLFDYNYLDGGGGNSGTKNMRINVNCPNLPSQTYNNYSYTFRDTCWYAIGTLRISWGWNRDKGSYGQLYMGDFEACTIYDTMKDKLIKGKYVSGITGGYSSHVNTSTLPTPWNETWGDVNSARGTIIPVSNPYAAVSVCLW